MIPKAKQKPLKRRTPPPPEAVIERTGKYWFNVYIRYGMARYGPYNGRGWSCLGYERAYKKGQKELKKYNKRLSYKKEVTVLK